ncbi:hypothetical protein OJ996_20945 [Luteolibacter sp. GHJ8]|uniref:SLA1 homology domain-containing protein n=1 Tax=Luteolibacter rhizosphaerae TaxID=2989719 RepID=A0ABT3G893_9BACT|nr:hypothetical protein [Luteolibacter rhizosphaerae]MCW1916069.1 hypothetical protein [Luteolibacter rhizosphaerae]
MKLLLALLALTLLAPADELQVWTSRKGETFSGNFLAVRPGKVFVRGPDKKIFAIPMEKLTDSCLAEAGYLQDKLGAWAREQVNRKAMNEASAWAVLMLAPEAIDGKVFLIKAHVEEIVKGKETALTKGKVKFKTESGIEGQADFKATPIVVKDDAVYTGFPANLPDEEVNQRNAIMVLSTRSDVALQVKATKGKIVGGYMATSEDMEKAREEDGKVVEYEAEIVRLRMIVMEEQIRSGAAVRGGASLTSADRKPLTVPPHRFTPEELEAIKAELSWLKTKIPHQGFGG